MNHVRSLGRGPPSPMPRFPQEIAGLIKGYITTTMIPFIKAVISWGGMALVPLDSCDVMWQESPFKKMELGGNSHT